MAASPSPPERLRKPNEHHVEWLLRRCWDRVNVKNQHLMLCIVGEEGSGKSWTALKIAEALDPDFNADRVIFDVVELLKILSDGRHEPGNFYVLDEAGVQLGRRTWQQRAQVLANQALQIIRDENLGLIFTLPALGDLDSQTQRRLQAFYELTEKEAGEYVRGKWKFMDPDRTDETGKIYKKYPRRNVNGRAIRVTDIAFTPPSDELVEPYSEKKSKFQQRHYRETIEEFEGEGEDDEGDEELGPKDIVKILREDREALESVTSEHGTTGEPRIDDDLIRVEFGLSTREARAAKKLADNDDEVNP